MSPEFINALALVLALGLGFLLKRNPKVQNQSIPIINFIVQVLVRALAEISPAEAGVIGDVGKFANNIFMDAFVTTVLAGGFQGFNKNTLRFFGSVVKSILIQKGAEAAEKEAAKNGEAGQ